MRLAEITVLKHRAQLEAQHNMSLPFNIVPLEMGSIYCTFVMPLSDCIAIKCDHTYAHASKAYTDIVYAGED